jgi:hypothetical protein
MVSASLLLGLTCAALVSTASGTKTHNNHVSIKVHHGNATVSLSKNFVGAADTVDRAQFMGMGGAYCYYYPNSDHPGFDVGNKPAKDYHDCNEHCQNFKGCVTWSWNSHNGGTCWLKSHNAGSIDLPGTWSLSCEMIKDESLDGNGICADFPDIDFPGNDIGSKPGKHAGECCTVCEKTKGCSAYAWTNDNGGTCYLKSSVVPSHILYKKGVVSSTIVGMGQYGPVCPFEYDTDYAGNDIGNKPAQSAESCCSLCKDNKACKAYSWNNHNGGTCWMKSATGARSSAKGVVSATLFPTRY